MERRRRAGITVGIVVLAASLLIPASVAAAQSACPADYTLETAPTPGSLYWADRNGDGLQCNRVWQQGPHLRISNRDNKIV